MAKLEIHTLGWRGDDAVERPADADFQLYCRVFCDGKELPNVVRARTHHRRDFALTTVTFAGAVEIVTHTQESWNELGVQQWWEELGHGQEGEGTAAVDGFGHAGAAAEEG